MWIIIIAFLALIVSYITFIYTRKSYEISVLPCIKISFLKQDSSVLCYVKNIGSGVAFDIEIQEQMMRFEKENVSFHLELILKDNNMLDIGQKSLLDVKAYEIINDKKQVSLQDFVSGILKESDSKFLVTFKNIGGKRYYSIINYKIKDDHDYINISPPKKLSIFNAILDSRDKTDLINIYIAYKKRIFLLSK